MYKDGAPIELDSTPIREVARNQNSLVLGS